MKKMKKLVGLLLPLCLMLGMVSPAFAATPYKYTVELDGGLYGTIEGKTTFVCENGEKWTPTSDDFSVKVTNDKYYHKGFQISGIENREIGAAPVTQDYVLVATYGVKGETVRYTVNYVDENGNELHKSDTFEANVGDKPIVAYRYLEGYEPHVDNITKTLVEDESQNVFTFVYTKIPEPEQVNPEQPEQPETPQQQPQQTTPQQTTPQQTTPQQTTPQQTTPQYTPVQQQPANQGGNTGTGVANVAGNYQPSGNIAGNTGGANAGNTGNTGNANTGNTGTAGNANTGAANAGNAGGANAGANAGTPAGNAGTPNPGANADADAGEEIDENDTPLAAPETEDLDDNDTPLAGGGNSVVDSDKKPSVLKRVAIAAGSALVLAGGGFAGYHLIYKKRKAANAEDPEGDSIENDEEA